MRILLMLLVLVLAGCTTPYQEMGLTGGVKAEEISYGRYRITSMINGYTPPPLLADYLKLKAAETALENGSRYFVAEHVQDATQIYRYAAPGYIMHTGYGNFIYSAPSVSTAIVPKAYLTIRLVSPDSTPPGNALDAQEIIDTIGARVRS